MQNDRIALRRPGLFGQCQTDYPAKFMENLPIDSCVMTAGPAPKMNDKTCQSLSFASLGSLIVGAGDS